MAGGRETRYAADGDTSGDTRPARARILIRTREFWRHFECGGMAEWSMAVVLKTCRDRLYQPVMFRALMPRETDRI